MGKPDEFYERQVKNYLESVYAEYPFLWHISRAFPDWHSNPPPEIARTFHCESGATMAQDGTLDATRLCFSRIANRLTVIQAFELLAFDSDADFTQLSPAALFGRIVWKPKVNNKLGGPHGLIRSGAETSFNGGPAFTGGGFGLLRRYTVNDVRMPPLLVKPGGNFEIELETVGTGGIAIPANGFGLIATASGYTLPMQ